MKDQKVFLIKTVEVMKEISTAEESLLLSLAQIFQVTHNVSELPGGVVVDGHCYHMP
jgi:hypothetical protein